MATFDELPPCDALAEIARDFHRRGWMAGTAGNLSRRDPQRPHAFWITASGKPKGRLGAEDFLLIDIASGAVVETPVAANRPSAETSIHQAIYTLFPEAQACLHVHTVDAYLATARHAPAGLELPLPPLEMVKGLDIWVEDPKVSLPLFDNWLEVPRIAAEIRARFEKTKPAVPALMIRNHGITVWGNSLQQAYNRLEILEFIMSYLARSPD